MYYTEGNDVIGANLNFQISTFLQPVIKLKLRLKRLKEFIYSLRYQNSTLYIGLQRYRDKKFIVCGKNSDSLTFTWKTNRFN